MQKTHSHKSGGGGGMISDFKKNTETILRTNVRDRSDRAGGGCPPSHGREIFQFWGSESCNLGMHAVMRFFYRGGGGGSLPLEDVPDAREKKQGKGYPNQGWALNSRIAKRVSQKFGETGYPNRYDQNSSHAIIRGKGR